MTRLPLPAALAMLLATGALAGGKATLYFTGDNGGEVAPCG